MNYASFKRSPVLKDHLYLVPKCELLIYVDCVYIILNDSLFVKLHPMSQHLVKSDVKHHKPNPNIYIYNILNDLFVKLHPMSQCLVKSDVKHHRPNPNLNIYNILNDLFFNLYQMSQYLYASSLQSASSIMG